MKIEADSDSVIDYPHEDTPTMGMSHFLSLGHLYIATRGLMFSVCFVFQRDPLRDFEGRGFLPVWQISNHGLTAPGGFTLGLVPNV